jgi:glycosyltransferase involved in cell wall biosynthesis
VRILFETPLMHRAGTWFRCFHLARGLVRLGHRVTLVKIAADRRVVPRAFQEGGVEILETPRFWGARLSRSSTALPSDILARLVHVAASPHDVVQTFAHHPSVMLPALLARALPWQGAFFADWDDLWTDGGLLGPVPPPGTFARAVRDVDRWFEHRLKRAAAGVTVVSEDLRRRAMEAGVPEDRVRFVPNGCPIEEIRPGDRAALRARLGFPSDRPIAVYVGFGQYDLDLLFASLAILESRGAAPLCVVTGPHPDTVSREAERQGVGHQVRPLGLVPYGRMGEVIAAADVGLMPFADTAFNRARWPIKVGDYLAAGTPVVCCDVGEVGRILRGAGFGRASLPTPTAFADAIAGLLADPDPAALSRRAREAAEAMSWDAAAEVLDGFYRERLDRMRPAAA